MGIQANHDGPALDTHSSQSTSIVGKSCHPTLHIANQVDLTKPNQLDSVLAIKSYVNEITTKTTSMMDCSNQNKQNENVIQEWPLYFHCWQSMPHLLLYTTCQDDPQNSCLTTKEFSIIFLSPFKDNLRVKTFNPFFYFI